MRRAVFEARVNWRPIGIELGLNIVKLNDIEERYRGNDRRMEEVVSEWLNKQSLNPCWQSLVDVLKDRTVGEEGVAAAIVKKFIKTNERDVSGAVAGATQNPGMSGPPL